MKRLTAEHFKAITDINERRAAYLDYIGAFYNSNNRSVVSSQGCVYSATDTSPGCAIGQCLPESVAKAFDGHLGFARSPSIRYIMSDMALAELVPQWMQEMGTLFLKHVQLLHDVCANWDELGLTKAGYSEFDNIRCMVDTNEYLK